jgi:beta-ketoacyl-acyl-carrier-protein synthase II
LDCQEEFCMTPRIVVTGMGTVNPLGLNVAETWKNVLDGVSGVGPITQFDASDFLVQIACEIKDFDPEKYMPARETRRRDRFEQLASAAAAQALEQSGFEITDNNADRVGVIVSSAVGGLITMEKGIVTLNQDGPRRISPFLIPMFMPNGASGLIGIDIGARGPAWSIASACSSGADSVGQGWMLLRQGVVDICLVGGTESTICPIGIGCFDRVGALSRRNDDYSMTPAPFDKNRDGLVMGEGAAVLVLETEEHARARGAEILGEVAGYGSTADAFHVTAPHETGAGGAAAMRIAMQTAGWNQDEIGYINAHGTGTQLNDVAETRAVKAALGKHASSTPSSSTKSMTGHLMGATGALEAIFCLLAISDGVLPPTIHYQTPDPECDLDVVPNEARPASIKTALSNAFGFGGHNAVLALKAYSR